MLIAELKDNRGEWPLGRVMETYPGADGLMRAVKVQSKSNGGYYTCTSLVFP